MPNKLQKKILICCFVRTTFVLSSGYPSLVEDFGFPALESMACGIVVIAFDIGILYEMPTESLCKVNPDDYESIAEGSYSVLEDSDVRGRYTDKEKEQSRKFRWPKAVKLTLSAFQEAVTSIE